MCWAFAAARMLNSRAPVLHSADPGVQFWVIAAGGKPTDSALLRGFEFDQLQGLSRRKGVAMAPCLGVNLIDGA